jgi:hypothetical protein
MWDAAVPEASDYERMNVFNAVNALSLGNVPVSLFLFREITATCVAVASHVMPNQLHSVPVAAPQLPLMYQPAPLLRVYNVAKAFRSAVEIPHGQQSRLRKLQGRRCC